MGTLRPLSSAIGVGTGLLISCAAVYACSYYFPLWSIHDKPADPLFRFVKNGKAGYIDARGKIVIAPRFSPGDNSFGEFHEGLAAVHEKQGIEYVNRDGSTAFRADVWLSFDFSEGMAAASKQVGGKWGFLDRTGRFAIAPEYDWVDRFSDGLARVTVSRAGGSIGYIDTKGAFVIPPHLSYGYSFHEGRAAVILDGPCQIVNGGSCGRAEFQATKSNGGYDCRFAFIDKTGKPISDFRFDDAGDFSEGFAPVRIGDRWGYVDLSGQIAIAPQFESAEPFSEGLASVRVNQKAGFIDHTGTFAIAPQFQFAMSFSDRRSLVLEIQNHAETYRFIDRSGNPAFRGRFVQASSFTYGLAPVAYQLGRNHKGKFAWIDTSGKVVFSFDVN